MPASITLKNSQGQLFDYDDPTKAQADIDNLGFQQAAPAEVAQYDQQKADREKYGTTEQQALAMGELALSSGSFGLLQNDSPEAKARRSQLRKQSPLLAMGAEVAGAAIPGALTGGLGEAAELGGVGLRAGADFTSGLSLEAEQAKEQQRDISIGNVAMWTLGGVAAESLVRAGVNTVRGFVGNKVPAAIKQAEEYRSGAAFGEQYAPREAERVNGRPKTMGQDVAAETTARPGEEPTKPMAPLTNAGITRLAQHYDEAINDARILGQEAGNSLQESFSTAHSYQQEAEDLRGLVSTDDAATARQAQFFETHSKAAADLADTLQEKYPRTAGILRQHLENMNAAQDAAELATAGRKLKSFLQKSHVKAAIAQRSGVDVMGELVAQIDDVEVPLRKDLANSKIWGEKAASYVQRENEAWAGKDGFIQNAAEFNRAFTKVDAQRFDYDGSQNFSWNDEAFSSFIRKDRIAQKQVLTATNKMLDAIDRMTNIKQDMGVRVENLTQVRQDTNSLRKVFQQARDISQVAEFAPELLAREGNKLTARQTVIESLHAVGHVLPGGSAAARALDRFWTPEITPFQELKTRAQAEAAVEARLSSYDKMHNAQAPIPSLDQLGNAPGTGVTPPATPKSPDPLGGTPATPNPLGGTPATPKSPDPLGGTPATPKSPDPLGGTPATPKAQIKGNLDQQLGSVPHADKFGNTRRIGELTAQDINDQDLDQLSEHGRAYVDRQAALFASSGTREPPLAPAAVRFAEGYSTLTDAYNARLGWLREATINPKSLVDKLGSSFGALPDTHPLAFSGIAATAARGAAYLTAHLPPGVAFSLAHPNGTPASRDQMTEFARLWDAVWTPANAIRDLATGRATPSQLDAMAEVHPEVFRDLQAKAVTHLARRTTPAPYETQRYLDQLLRLDGAANPALSWSVANSIQAALQSAKPQGSNITPTPTQRNVGPTNPRGIASLANGPTFGGA